MHPVKERPQQENTALREVNSAWLRVKYIPNVGESFALRDKIKFAALERPRRDTAVHRRIARRFPVADEISLEIRPRGWVSSPACYTVRLLIVHANSS